MCVTECARLVPIARLLRPRRPIGASVGVFPIPNSYNECRIAPRGPSLAAAPGLATVGAGVIARSPRRSRRARLAVLAAGWGRGLTRAREQLGGGLSPGLGRLATAWVRWVVPGSLAAILIGFIMTSAPH